MKIFKVIFLIITFLISGTPIFAEEPKFSVAIESIYKVFPDGNTNVTQNFTLTNLSSDFFPKEYVLPPLDSSVTNLRASDRLGHVRIESNHIKFTDQVVGIGKILRWNLAYDSKNIANRVGRLWQINVPGTPALPGQTQSAIRLIVPTQFGKQVFIKPSVSTSDLFWQSTSLPTINVIFDPNNEDIPYQSFDFLAKYHLYNSRLYPVTASVPLPPDTQYQKIFLNELTPKPKNVILDKSGNWLAQYPLGPASKLEVIAEGIAALFLQPKTETSNPTDFLAETKYWPSVKQEPSTPKNIYNHVVSILNYNPKPDKYTRLGGRGAIQSPNNATSLEFSDLFITLARSIKIPARQVFGYLTQKPETLHIWVEYFDQESGTWRMVDPTLEKIDHVDHFDTLDFRHLTLVRQGDSTLPFNQIDFKIIPSQKDLDVKTLPTATAVFNLPNKITAGFSTTGKIFLENLGPTLFSPDPVSLKSNTLNLETQIYLPEAIPPFGNQEFSAKILPSPWFRSGNDIITLKFGSTSQNYRVTTVPIYNNFWVLLFIILLILGFISLIAQITRGLSLRKR